MITATGRRTFVERSEPSGLLRVDRERGTIIGAKLCGIRSDNGRIYPLDVLRAARPLYEGARVNVGHPKSARALDRDFSDWAGVVENVQVRADGLYGDLVLRRAGVHFAAIIEAAERFPRSFGLSHVAFGDGRKVNGVEEVLSIDEVASVDVVLEPATTGGLFESRQRHGYGDELLESLRIRDDLQRRVDELERDAAELVEIEAKHAKAVERSRATLAGRRQRHR